MDANLTQLNTWRGADGGDAPLCLYVGTLKGLVDVGFPNTDLQKVANETQNFCTGTDEFAAMSPKMIQTEIVTASNVDVTPGSVRSDITTTRAGIRTRSRVSASFSWEEGSRVSSFTTSRSLGLGGSLQSDEDFLDYGLDRIKHFIQSQTAQTGS